MPPLRLLELEPRTVPATFTVTSLADSGAGSLRAALAQADASPGKDTIVFKLPAPLVHGENMITLTSGELTSKGDVTIKGPGAGKLIISGNGASRVFDINDGSATTDSPTAISGLSIISGAIGTVGGGIYSGESLSLTGVVLSHNSAASLGGAVAVLGSQGAEVVTVTKSQVFGNSAGGALFFGRGGGLYIDGVASINLNQSIISGNTAGNNLTVGGGVYGTLNSTGTGMSVSGCTVTGNSASVGGGMCLVSTSMVPTAKTIVNGCTVSGNTASDFPGSGGGLELQRGNSIVSGCTVSNNTAVYNGGGIDAGGFASVTISKSRVTGNQTTNSNVPIPGGGGLFIQGDGTAPLVPATISGCVVSNNASASDGGGALVTGGVKLTVTGSTFAADRAVFGGGLLTDGTGANQVAASIAECKFAGDTSGQTGGGVELEGDGPASVVSTNVTDCAATDGAGIAVALSPASNGFLMSDCMISGNAATEGGGVFISNTPDFHISRSSITDNWAADGAGGILVANSGGTLLGTTVSGNAAANIAGGIFNAGGGTITLQVAKVHGNTAPTDPDVDGPFTFV